MYLEISVHLNGGRCDEYGKIYPSSTPPPIPPSLARALSHSPLLPQSCARLSHIYTQSCARACFYFLNIEYHVSCLDVHNGCFVGNVGSNGDGGTASSNDLSNHSVCFRFVAVVIHNHAVPLTAKQHRDCCANPA